MLVALSASAAIERTPLINNSGDLQNVLPAIEKNFNTENIGMIESLQISELPMAKLDKSVVKGGTDSRMKAPQKTQTISNFSTEILGYGRTLFSWESEFEEGADTTFVYSVSIWDQDYENRLGGGLYYSSARNGVVSYSIMNNQYLPTGRYVIQVLGYNSYTSAGPGEQTEGAAYYFNSYGPEVFAIKDLAAVLNSDSTVTISWTTNNYEYLFDGAWYEVVISNADSTWYDSYIDENALIGGFGTLTDTVITPAVKLANNTYYTIEVLLYSNYGYQLGRYSSLDFTVGENPYAVKNLQATVDNQTMAVTFTWETTAPYSIIQVFDASYNVYEFQNAYQMSSGTWYTNQQTVTTEALPAGNYGFTVVPQVVSGNTLYAIAEEEFTVVAVTDVVAPVVENVELDSLAATAVRLKIEASDNAPDVEAADLLYSLTGDITITDTTLVDGLLLLEGLTEDTQYTINITAKDPSGNVSAAYPFTFFATNDTVAPTSLTATVKTVADKYAVITVSATDNKAAADQLTYIIAFNDSVSVETKATGDSIVLTGLAPETKYNINVKVKDIAGNVSATSVDLEFTTLALIPNVLTTPYAEANQANYSSYGVWGLYLYDVLADGETLQPEVDLYIYTPKANMLSGTYKLSDNTIMSGYTGISLNSTDFITATEAEVNVEIVGFVNDTTEDGITTYGVYNIKYSIIGDDENLYVGEYSGVVTTYFYSRTAGYYDVSVSDEPGFPVDERPVLTAAQVVEGSLTATSVTIHLEASDDYTALTDLKVFLTTDKVGTPLNEQADIKTGEGYSLDADGNFTIEGLEENKTYTLRVEIVDDRGQSCYATAMEDRVTVKFTTLLTGLDDLRGNTQATKVLENGQIFILRDGKKYTTLGAEVAR